MTDTELLIAAHSSLNIRFGTTAPYAIGAHRVERVGFAGDPAVTVPVHCRQQDMSALVPIVRQRVYAELAERGIDPHAVEFSPSIGGSYRTRKFRDENPSSPTEGRNKMGCALEFRFFMNRTLAAACDWTSYSYGRLPERVAS